MEDNRGKEHLRLFKKGLKYSFLLSLFIHLVMLGYKIKDIDFKKFTNSKQKKIRIVLADFKKEDKVKEIEKKSEKKKQIVQTEKTGRKEIPVDSRFLSETNQTFDRQTVAKQVGSFKMAGKGVKEGQKVKSKAKKGTLAKKVAKKDKSKNGRQSKKIKLADLALGKIDFTKEENTPSPNMAALGLENGASGEIGLSRNNDYVNDLPMGDVTNLNTIEYKYYGFYHRIKQKLEQYWGNSLREKAETLYKQGRRLPASSNAITSLVITIDDSGNIVEIVVKSTSGIRELDDAAIESFNRAGPFPNPPKGMMKGGIAKIEWGFVVKG